MLVLFLKAKMRGDDRTSDLFGGSEAPGMTRVKGHVRKDGAFIPEHNRKTRGAKPKRKAAPKAKAVEDPQMGMVLEQGAEKMAEPKAKPADVVPGVKAEAKQAAWSPPTDPTKRADFRQMLEDNIATKRSSGDKIPDAWIERLEQIKAVDAGIFAEPGKIVARQVFGHPMETDEPKYANLVPIKFESGYDFSERIARAEKLASDMQAKFGRAHAIKAGRINVPPKEKKAMLSWLGSANATEDEHNLGRLRSETIPELYRLAELSGKAEQKPAKPAAPKAEVKPEAPIAKDRSELYVDAWSAAPSDSKRVAIEAYAVSLYEKSDLRRKTGKLNAKGLRLSEMAWDDLPDPVKKNIHVLAVVQREAKRIEKQRERERELNSYSNTGGDMLRSVGEPAKPADSKAEAAQLRADAAKLRKEAAAINAESKGRAGKGLVDINADGSYTPIAGRAAREYRELRARADRLNKQADALDPKKGPATNVKLQVKALKTDRVHGGGNFRAITNIPQRTLDALGWKGVWLKPGMPQLVYAQKGATQDERGDELIFEGDIGTGAPVIAEINRRLGFGAKTSAPKAEAKPAEPAGKAAQKPDAKAADSGVKLKDSAKAKKPSKKSVEIDSVYGLREIDPPEGEQWFVRWSRGEVADKKSPNSRDYASGETHEGLSAVPWPKGGSLAEKLSAISEYMFLRLKDPKIRPHIYAAKRIGTDTDEYALISDIATRRLFSNRFIGLIDAGIDKAVGLQEKIESSVKRIERSDVIGKTIHAETAEKARGQLNELLRASPRLRAEMDKLNSSDGADPMTKSQRLYLLFAKAEIANRAGMILFLKSGPLSGRAGLRQERRTDKLGRNINRWVKAGEDPKAERKQAAPEAPKGPRVARKGDQAGQRQESAPEQAPAGDPHVAAVDLAKRILPAEKYAHLGKVKAQPIADPQALFAKAKGTLDSLKEWLDKDKGLAVLLGYSTMPKAPEDVTDEEWAQHKGLLFIAPLKGQERASEKVKADYKGDWTQLTDVVRCSLVAENLHDVERLVKALEKNGFKPARTPKNKFTGPTPQGYRDFNYIVEMPDGLLAEVQINIKDMMKAKNAGHHYYEVTRKIEDKYKAAGKTRPNGDNDFDQWDPADLAEWNANDDKQRAIYGRAWQEHCAQHYARELRKSLNMSILRSKGLAGDRKMSVKYAEVDGVVYRATDGRHFAAKAVGGEWVPNHEMAKVSRDGYPMTEEQAKEWAGKDWPKNQTATAA